MNIIQFQRPVLSAWSNFVRQSHLRDELDRLFASPLGELTRTARQLSHGTPALDVYDTKENYVVKAEVPGLKREDIDVSFEDGDLTISGDRKNETAQEEAVTYRAERAFGRFERTVTLPVTVAADKITASYKDGVLTITLPKSEAAKPKQIDVSIN